MVPDVDAIRASLRILHANSATAAIDREAATRAQAGHSGPAAAAVAPGATPRVIESSSSGARARGDPSRSRDGPTDDAARLRELWVRDMAVRAEAATDPPDGSLPEIPSFVYDLGPDGRPYAADAAQHDDAVRERESEPGELGATPDDARATGQRDDVPAVATSPPRSAEAEAPQARARAPDPPRDDATPSGDAPVRSDVVRAYRGEPDAKAHFDLVV